MKKEPKMQFSCADLVKQSATQILYNHENDVQKKITDGISFGESYQKKISSMIPDTYSEMVGVYVKDMFEKKLSMFFANDIVGNGFILEVKSTMPDIQIPEWYFHQSILQSALYHALIKTNIKDLGICPLVSASYTNENNSVMLKESPLYFLLFNKEIYSIFFTNEHVIAEFVKFYRTKALYVSEGWESAKHWNINYNRKEWEIFKDYIVVDKVPDDQYSIFGTTKRDLFCE